MCPRMSITYTESGKPNLKLVSKEYCHRELRKMLGGGAQPAERANEFWNFSDAELLAERGERFGDQGGADDRAERRTDSPAVTHI